MLAPLKELLGFLPQVLNRQQQDEVKALHRRALRWESVPRLPLVLWSPLPSDARFRPYPHSEIFDDPEKMLFNELVDAFMTSIACLGRLDHDLPCTIRANFGTVVMASYLRATEG